MSTLQAAKVYAPEEKNELQPDFAKAKTNSRPKGKTMNLVNLLLQKFNNNPHVPLVDVAREYYAINDPKTIKTMARKGEFPYLRPFQMRDSKDAPFFVTVENLADALEKRQNDAKLSRL